jgi:hypothetical protein
MHYARPVCECFGNIRANGWCYTSSIGAFSIPPRPHRPHDWSCQHAHCASVPWSFVHRRTQNTLSRAGGSRHEQWQLHLVLHST